jgi:hypothetical protein
MKENKIQFMLSTDNYISWSLSKLRNRYKTHKGLDTIISLGTIIYIIIILNNMYLRIVTQNHHSLLSHYPILFPLLDTKNRVHSINNYLNYNFLIMSEGIEFLEQSKRHSR